MKPAPQRCVSASAFNLIELLVVLGIIGLLIAILLPVLSAVRASGRTTQCTNNVRSIGLATQVYTIDYNNRLPYEDRGEEAAGFSCWVDVLYDEGYLSRVDAERDVLICPNVEPANSISVESYRMNSKLAETNPSKANYDPNPKLDSFPRQSQTVVYFDADVGGNRLSFKGRWRAQDDDVNYRHRGSTVVGFLDWHVQAYQKADLANQSINNAPVIWLPKHLGAWTP